MASGFTPIYIIPYPLPTDPVDVSGDIEDLADRLEIVLQAKAGLTEANIFTNTNVFSVNSSSTAVRITQTGSGSPFVVEDAANPDASPFIITNSGDIGVGITIPTEKMHIVGNQNLTGILFVGEDAKTDYEDIGTKVNTVTFKEINTNKAILTTVNPHEFFPGLLVDIALSPADPIFDGQYEITEIISNTRFAYTKVNANISNTASGGTASAVPGFTNPIALFTADASDYAQLIIHNLGNSASSSTDVIAYADNGNDYHGWIDMGITSSGFNDPSFTITGENDGYIFMSAPYGTTGAGNLVIATDGTGTENKIVFAAGGLSTDNTQMSITPDVNVHIEIPTPSTSATTGAFTVVGGVGIQGDIYVDGELTLLQTSYFGANARAFETAAALTAAVSVFSIEGPPSSFAQIAFKNAEPTSSTDIIAYMDNGTDSEGWVGMGIAGSDFDDATYGITGPGDGYIFHETKLGALGPEYTGNLVFATGSNGTENKLVFAAGGFSSGNTQMEITPDVNVHIEIPTPSTSNTTGALTVVGGVGITGDTNTLGYVSVEGMIYGGDDAKTFETSALLTNPRMVIRNTELTPQNSFSQIAFQNADASSSTDIIVYMDNGDDSEGWMGIGIAGSAFDDATYGITAPGDGYIFHQTKTGASRKGNMVLATGDAGTENKIIFAAGGFASGNTQMEITPDVNVHIEIPTPSTSPTTGALTVVGGVGIQGDVNIQGNTNITGTITFGGGGTTVETENLNVTDPAIFIGNGNQNDIVDLSFVGEFTVAITPISRSVTFKSITSEVATLTTSVAHTFIEGDVVTITGVGAPFNATINVLDTPTATTFRYRLTGQANVPNTAVSPVGTAVANRRRRYYGLSRDATDGIVKLFTSLGEKPTTTVNYSDPTIAFATLQTGALNTTTSTIGTLTLTNPLTIANGGVGFTSYATGDIIYASAANTLSKLGIGSTGQFLTVSGGIPAWGNSVASIASTGTISTTAAWNASTGSAQIFLNGATGNRIDFNVNGVAAPSLTTRSVGTKIVIWPALSATLVDYAIGIDSATLWSSVPSSGNFFRWYAGTTNIATLTGAGAFSAVTKSFDIEHPTKEGMRLRYGSLEGPENGVYVRGKSKEKIISLPDYWTGLVDADSITVQLTAIGTGTVYVDFIANNAIKIGGTAKEFFYFVQAERKDVDKLTVEY